LAKALKVLIIDDSEDDTLLLLRHLVVNGMRVAHRRVDTIEGLDAALSEVDWDLVICDYSLPTLSPNEAVKRVRQFDEHVPLIIVTLYVEKPELVQLIKLGAQDIVLKDNLARLIPVIEQELAEAQLRRDKMVAEAHLLSAIESITEGMALFNSADRLNICNRRYSEILDKCAPIIKPDMPFEDLLRYAVRHGQIEEIGDDVEAFVQRRLAMRRAPGESFVQRLSGERWVRVEGRSTADGGLISVLTDITENKKLDMMKNEFISLVGHELRTPLTSIKGSLALLEAGIQGELPDRAKVMIHIAHKNSDRLMRLINDFLDLQKIEYSKIHFEYGEIAIRPLLREAVLANQYYAEEYGVCLRLTPMQDDVMVMADYDRLMQVFANLLSNAVKFSPSGSTVSIGAAQQGDVVRISIADQGIGISEDFRHRVFQKFSQADTSDTRNKGGSGLGLVITKAIVENHGGKIGFDSVQGKGTTFYFELPVRQKEAANIAAESGAQPGSAMSLGQR
jgi:signal transduction histidine kinase/DNA-binding NarL/FixJ family response regulator